MTDLSKRLTTQGWTDGGSLRSLLYTQPNRVTNVVPSMNSNNNLLSFLAVLQHYGIDPLSTLFESSLSQIERGATSQIHQTYVEQGDGFVFKVLRIKDESGLEDAEATFNALVSEISVLSHPSLQHHHSIVDFETVCWEMQPEKDCVWPILVLERAKHGNLDKFMKTEQGRQTTLTDRLDFCISIASAVFAMHTHNFVHGDIKPHNVLVFAYGTGLLCVKLTDFGFAGWAADSDSDIIVKPPKTVPWNAPEHHHRGFTIRQAKSMDIYSLGLLCLWLLFHDISIDESMRKLDDNHMKSFQKFGQVFQDTAYLESLKISGTIGKLALRLARGASSIDKRATDLVGFFNSTLAVEPQARRLALAQLEPSLTKEWILGPSNMDLVPITEVEHATVEFHIGESISFLLNTHIRFRKIIVSLLQEQASYHVSISTRQNAAFQLALCYRIGLGTASDESHVAHWLEIAHKTPKDLNDETDIIREKFMKRRFFNNHLNDSMDKGMRLAENSKKAYGVNLTTDDESTLRREIQDISTIFKPTTFSIISLKMTLCNLLIVQERFHEAESIIFEMMQELKNAEQELVKGGEKAHLLFTHKARRFNIEDLRHTQPGVFPKLQLPNLRLPDVGLARAALESVTAMVIEEDLESTQLIGDLAEIYTAQGRYHEAVWLRVWLADQHVRLLGQSRQPTLLCLEHLSDAYQRIGKLEEAEEILKYVSIIWEYRLGLRNQATLGAYKRLALLSVKRMNLRAAKSIILRVLRIEERMLKLESPAIHDSMTILGEIYQRQGETRKAEEVLRKACESYEDFSDDRICHPIGSMLLLATVYNANWQFDKAENACIKALAIKLQVGSTETRQIIYSRIKYQLGLAYLCQKRVDEAEHVITLDLEESRRILGDDHIQTTYSVGLLAEILHQLGRCGEEQLLIESLITNMSLKNEPNSERPLPFVPQRLWCLWKNGRRFEAWMIFLHFSYNIIAIRRLWRSSSRLTFFLAASWAMTIFRIFQRLFSSGNVRKKKE